MTAAADARGPRPTTTQERIEELEAARGDWPHEQDALISAVLLCARGLDRIALALEQQERERDAAAYREEFRAERRGGWLGGGGAA